MQVQELKVKDVADEQLHFYRFQAKNHAKLTGRLFINDVEIHQFSPEHLQISCPDIHYWLMPGENRLTISIEQAEITSSEDFNPLYSCSLHGMSNLSLPDDANCLWKIELLELEEMPPVSYHYNFYFTSLQVPSSDLWRRAEKVDVLTPDEQSEIINLKENLAHAFEEGDTPTLMGMYEYVLNEEASMSNKKLDESINMLNEEFNVLSEMAKGGYIKFEHTNDYYFNHLAGNRVVQLCSDNGEPAIKMCDDEGESIGINIFASKINGAWNLVRR